MIFLLFIFDAFAAPSIASTSSTLLQHGSSLTLTGSNFGTKAEAAPLKFDQFEGGQVGSIIGNGWLTDTGGGNLEPVYNTTHLRPFSTLSVSNKYENTQYLNTFGVYRGDGDGLESVYMDFWVLFDRPPSGPVSRNHKLIRLYPDREGGLPNQVFICPCPNISPSCYFTNDAVNNLADGSTAGWGDTHAYTSPSFLATEADQQWTHMQFYLRQSGAGVRDGRVVAFFNGGGARVDRSDYVSRDGLTNTANTWHSLWFGNFLGIGEDIKCERSGPHVIHFDDVYVDVMQARVEAGDAASYAACSVREIQPCTAWTANEVTITVNAGQFTEGTDVWLFLVDELGGISDGFGPLKVGSRVVVPTASPPPSPPTDSMASTAPLATTTTASAQEDSKTAKSSNDDAALVISSSMLALIVGIFVLVCCLLVSACACVYFAFLSPKRRRSRNNNSLMYGKRASSGVARRSSGTNSRAPSAIYRRSRSNTGNLFKN